MLQNVYNLAVGSTLTDVYLLPVVRVGLHLLDYNIQKPTVMDMMLHYCTTRAIDANSSHQKFYVRPVFSFE